MIESLQNPLLAAADSARSTLEFEWPESTGGRLAWVVVVLLLLAFVIYAYIRDTRSLKPFWRFWLLGLRLAVIGALVVVALNPSRRTPEMLYRPSQLAILVDTSLSMGYPERDEQLDGSSQARSRSQAVRELLSNRGLIEKLQQDHQVAIYTFDSQLEGPQLVAGYQGAGRQLTGGEVSSDNVSSDNGSGSDKADSNEANGKADWDEMLRPRGLDTRLGDAVRTLVGRIRSRTLAGVLVLTDGESNAGFHPDAAHDAARANNVRLVSVGVGGTEPQKNLQLVSLQAPSIARSDDAFEIRALVQGQGFAGQQVVVKLSRQEESDTGAQFDAIPLESRELQLFEDGTPQEIVFTHSPSEDEGRFQYIVDVEPVVPVKEWSTDDNQRRKEITLSRKRTSVLLAAGGPVRDYRFLRNMLNRHPGFRVDVWLQTIDASAFSRVTQDADNVLPAFPESLAELDEYDVIVAFDPDWRTLNEDQRQALVRWVNERSGGLILVAGDVYTPELASAGNEMDSIRELYPVFLSEFLLAGGLESENDSPWAVGLTDAGREAGHLMLDESPEASVQGRVWERWDGVYRAYPTAGAKAGATIYAFFTDVRTQTEHGLPVLLASQFFGSGRTYYIGSPEIWRVRALAEDFYDRFWVKLIGEVGQSRRQRGSSRGVLLLERGEYALGQTVRVRARLYDRQLNELDVESVELRVAMPDQQVVDPPPRLTQEANQPGQFTGDFRVSQIGTYQLELEIPEGRGESGGETGRDTLREKIDVRLPNLEAEHPEQNVAALQNLVRDTGGRYLSLEDALAEVPALFPNRGEEIVVSEWPETLWDRSWVLYLLVGLLSLEWLTRKLLKLA